TRLLYQYPRLHGVLFDLAGTAALAAKRIATVGLADRCVVKSGDFFQEVPSGGDLYLLCHILHDWSDEQAARLNATVARATAPGPRPERGYRVVVGPAVVVGSSLRRYSAVEPVPSATIAGGPAAMIRPPWSLEPGPISINQSSMAAKCRLCSATRIVLPASSR